ncbi:Na+/solute symporter [Thalassoporum mexicanum PCC 7367]|uniref:sodium:solute symporter family protein n=1 Tax=Thalassoporum mexicanum TaxID=3457544 RepID=UPI00029FAF92|nr:sodium:solute symporter family protein [Pseudanabaena sp. PCC 7367]AFY69816.1 Na+/solute symporter [Pseudanabaena sp. PCC 7367]
MQTIDWIVVVAYLGLSMALGIYLSRRAAKSMLDFFVSGRSLSWWLAGTSMAATTFSIDTPLYVAGVVASRGIAGNWEWWSFGIAHVVMIYIFAKMWRRSEVLTDAEIIELRYGGRAAKILRATKAFLFAVPINCIGIGYAMLAMVKVVDALQLISPSFLAGLPLGLANLPESGLKLCIVIGVGLLVLVYAGFSGLWGVVATDFLQFMLALVGAILVAIFAVAHFGGMANLLEQVQQATDLDVLSFTPLSIGQNGTLIQWQEAAGISASTFLAYIFLQWWSFRRSDGGGEFIQRLLAAKDEAEAEKAAWWFNILHYVIRTWPWIVVSLAAIALYPNMEDPEQGYPRLMLEFLPPVLLGLVVASLVAAFMSTVSTLINWGASYLTNDLYYRFMRPDASGAELVLAGRIASVVITALGATAAFYIKDVATIFRLIIAIGTGPGLVLILRWFWWRINAAAELAAMLGGFVIGLLTSVLPQLTQDMPSGGLKSLLESMIAIVDISDFGMRLLVTTSITAIIWIVTMLLTAPETNQTLDAFYMRVRPGGPGWQKQRQRTGLEPAQNLGKDLLRVVAATLVLFSSMFTIGGFLLHQQVTGWLMLAIAVLSFLWLRRLNLTGNLLPSRAGEPEEPDHDQ